MSALNLLNHPDTFGNYFQATPTPLPPIPYHKNAVPNTLFGAGKDNSKQVVRRKQPHQPSRHRVNSSRKQLTNPIDILSRNRNNANTDISNDLVRKKPIHQFHERPHHSNKDSTSTLDNVANENKNSELSYNDIYKQMSVPKHANDKYENKHGSEKKRNQFSIKNLFSSFSNNQPTVESFNNKGVDETQDYYEDYYEGEYTDSYDTKSTESGKHMPTKQLSNSANDYPNNRDELLKRFGESENQNPDWSISHPATEEELRDMMKYDPYYAQYYYSKYRPQEDEGRRAEDGSDGEDYISKKIRNVRDNNSIFRQDNGDAGNILQTAMTVFSVVMNLFGGGSGGQGGGALDVIGNLLGGGGGSSSSSSQSTNKIDRIDTDNVDAAISTINQASGSGTPDDLDVAMGTLMAYSGKFLRQIGLWAFEHATQTSSDTFSESAIPSIDKVGSVLGGGGGSGSGGASVVTVTSDGKPYLSTLSQPELEKLGLKAVAAGAKPQKLQQAFITAQTNGDWSQLESLIGGALGQNAITNPSAGNPIAGISNFVSNFVGGLSPTKVGNNPPSSSDGPSYSQVVQNPGGGGSETGGILDKLSMVWNGDPTADPLTQGNIATRFVSTFGLQQEALSLQSGLNSVIKTVNGFLGEESSASDTNSGDYFYVDV